jgi:hypothetical protein
MILTLPLSPSNTPVVKVHLFGENTTTVLEVGDNIIQLSEFEVRLLAGHLLNQMRNFGLWPHDAIPPAPKGWVIQRKNATDIETEDVSDRLYFNPDSGFWNRSYSKTYNEDVAIAVKEKVS